MAAAALVLLVIVYFAYSSHEASVKADADQIQKQHDYDEAQKKQLADQKSPGRRCAQKSARKTPPPSSLPSKPRKRPPKKGPAPKKPLTSPLRAAGSISQPIPAGRAITVGNLPSRTSPALFANVRIGNYPVTVSLPEYQSARLNIEVKENEAADPGVIKLAHQSGSLELTSEPQGASYSVRPAGEMLLLNTSGLNGTTPATLNNLATGDYTVTFSLEGFQTHSETVSVSHDTPAQNASWKFVNGNVLVTSMPSGATVASSDGRVALVSHP